MQEDGLSTAWLHRLNDTQQPREMLASGLAEALASLGAPAGVAWLLDELAGVLEWVACGLPGQRSDRLGQLLAARVQQLQALPGALVLPPDHVAREGLPLPGAVLYVPLGRPEERLGGALLTTAALPADHGRRASAVLTISGRLALAALQRGELAGLRLLRERNRLARGLHYALARGVQGLVLALELLADNLRQQQGIQVETSLAALKLPIELQELLFHIALEALHNAQRHANCRHMQITLAGEPGWVALTVADDGRGFDPTRTEGGAGLKAIRAACRRVGGQLLIEAGPLVGTHLRAELPWSEA